MYSHVFYDHELLHIIFCDIVVFRFLLLFISVPLFDVFGVIDLFRH